MTAQTTRRADKRALFNVLQGTASASRTAAIQAGCKTRVEMTLLDGALSPPTIMPAMKMQPKLTFVMYAKRNALPELHPTTCCRGRQVECLPSQTGSAQSRQSGSCSESLCEFACHFCSQRKHTARQHQGQSDACSKCMLAMSPILIQL